MLVRKALPHREKSWPKFNFGSFDNFRKWSSVAYQPIGFIQESYCALLTDSSPSHLWSGWDTCIDRVHYRFCDFKGKETLPSLQVSNHNLGHLTSCEEQAVWHRKILDVWHAALVPGPDPTFTRDLVRNFRGFVSHTWQWWRRVSNRPFAVES